MIKKIFIAALLVISYTVSFCQQENDYVEVVLQDSIKVDPDEIIFSLILRADANYTGVDNKITGARKKSTWPGNTEEKIKKIIAEQKTDTLSANEYAILKESYTGIIKRKFLLHFTKLQQLAVFIKEVNNLDNVLGFIVSKKTSQSDYYKQVLTKRLLEKAFSEASYIAGQGKKTIVKLIQVRDESSEKSPGGWTSYPPLSALAEFQSWEDNTQIIIERKLRVRYAWQ